MSRRAAALICALAVSLVLSLLPWRVGSDRIQAAVARQIREAYGLHLAVGGPVTVSVLPVPRIKLSSVSLSDSAGRVWGEAAQVTSELRLSSLFLARVRIADLRIAHARITFSLSSEGEQVWTRPLDRIGRRVASRTAFSSHVDRVQVIDATVLIRDAKGRPQAEVSRVNAVMRWPEPTGEAAVTASGEWRGEVVSMSIDGLDLARLAGDGADPITFGVVTRLGRLNGSGDLALSPALRFGGLVTAETRSLGKLARWTGFGRDLQDLDQPVMVSGQSSFGPSGVEWPRATIDIGQDRLEGALAYRLDLLGRSSLRATLAGGNLDLGWVLPLVQPGRVERPRSNYDVRLSAQQVRLGPLRLDDIAAGILVSGERLDVSLARARLAGGSVRGRLSASLDGEGSELRGQVTLTRVDLETLLSEAGVEGLSGTLAAQASFEAVRDGEVDLVRQLRGHVKLKAVDGEIPGISLGAAKKAVAGPAGSAAPAWLGGRTRFTEAVLALDIQGGLAELTEGRIGTAGTQTSLRGRVSLPDRTVLLRATTWPTEQAPRGEPSPLVLDVHGPVHRPTFTPVLAEAAPATDAGGGP